MLLAVISKMLLNKLLIVILTVNLVLIPANMSLAQTQPSVILGVVNHEGDEIIGKSDLGNKQLPYQDIIDYIASKLGNSSKPNLLAADNLSAMVDLLKEQKVDLYVDSPLTSALVDNKSKATPFLAIWLQKKPSYNSLIVAKKNSPIIYHLYDLHGGKTIGFTSVESNIGYLLPKSYLISNGLKFSPPSSPADLIYLFTGGENNTLAQLLNGPLDVGALSSTYFNSLPSSVSSKLKVVGDTMDIPIAIISYRSDISPKLIDQISNIIKGMKSDAQAPESVKKFAENVEFDFNPTKLVQNLTGLAAQAINGTESSYF